MTTTNSPRNSSRPPTFKLVCLICAALALVGVTRSIYFQIIVEREGKHLHSLTGVDSRYEALKRILPPDQRFGYFSDKMEGNPFDDGRYIKALYALAPRILIRQSESFQYFIADMEHPESIPAMCERHGLESVVTFPQGTALLRRKNSP